MIFDVLEDSERAAGAKAATTAISQEHLVIFPTDTGYALGGDAFSAAATRRIRTIKGMVTDAPLQVLISGVRALEGVAENATDQVRSLADAFWPGPLTLVVPTSRSISWDIGGHPQVVQVRVPDHPVATDLLSRAGPLAVSAARSSNSPIVESVEDVHDLQHHVAMFLNFGAIKQGGFSTIVDCTSGEAVVLRKGPITVGQLVDVLGYMPRVLAAD